MRAKRFAWAMGGAALAGLIWAGSMLPRQKASPPILTLQPGRILADGSDWATLTVASQSTRSPGIFLAGNVHGATLENLSQAGGVWRARLRAGVMPGKIGVTVEVPGYAPAATELTTVLDPRDTAEDGTPDFLRLYDAGDQHVFRRWFTWLAEAQYFQAAEARPAEIDDCAALIRYAYREALRAHDGAWARTAGLPVVPAFHSVAKYQYPFTALGTALFRVTEGSFRSGDLAAGAFLQFADARTLWRYNTHFVSRDLTRAQPGDLLFFRQETDHVSFHSMIYLGESHLRPDGRAYVIYHTGPEAGNPGEMRRLSVDELLHFPQAEWRPLPGNTRFLGIHRWNILRTENSHAGQS